jgi:WD40 repeat protein
VFGCGFSLDGSKIVSCSNDETVRVWDANESKLIHTMDDHTDWASGKLGVKMRRMVGKEIIELKGNGRNVNVHDRTILQVHWENIINNNVLKLVVDHRFVFLVLFFCFGLSFLVRFSGF